MAYIISAQAGTAADVLPAKRSGTKPAPCTIIWSQRAKDVGKGQNTGTFEIETAVMVKSEASEDGDAAAEAQRLASDQRAGKTFDAFYTDNDTAADKLAADITAAARALALSAPAKHADLADYTCQNVVIEAIEAGLQEDGAAWIDTLNLVIIACPSNVS